MHCIVTERWRSLHHRCRRRATTVIWYRTPTSSHYHYRHVNPLTLFSQFQLYILQPRGNYFLTGGGGVKIMRATFRGVHKSVIDDNKTHTVLDLVSEYNIIMMQIPCGCAPENISFQKSWGVKIPCLTRPGKFPGGGHLTPPLTPRFPRHRYALIYNSVYCTRLSPGISVNYLCEKLPHSWTRLFANVDRDTTQGRPNSLHSVPKKHPRHYWS